MNKKFKGIIFVASVFLIVGVASFIFFGKLRNNDKNDEDKINVIVSILPQKEFVKAVGRDAVNVTELIHPGQSPELYSPTPSDLILIENADIYFRIGYIPFEDANIAKIKETNPDLQIIDLSPKIELRYFSENEEHSHDEINYKSKCEGFGGTWLDSYSECEGDSSSVLSEDQCLEINGEYNSCESACRNNPNATACTENCVVVCKVSTETHTESEIDPHVWLSPKNVMKIVEQVYDVMVEKDPDNASYYKANALSYFNQLTALDTNLSESLSGIANSKLLVFHPAWGYFADDYNLTQVAIEADGKDPTVSQISSIVNLIKDESINVIFVQSQFSTKTAESIASDTGVTVVSIDPLAENYIENMSKIGEVISENL